MGPSEVTCSKVCGNQNALASLSDYVESRENAQLPSQMDKVLEYLTDRRPAAQHVHLTEEESYELRAAALEDATMMFNVIAGGAQRTPLKSAKTPLKSASPAF